MAVFKFSGRFSFFPIVFIMALAVRAPGVEPPQRPENANVTVHGLPHGATGRVGTFRFRVYDIAPVQSLEFSPDGKYLAAVLGPRVLVWNAATGDLLRDLATSRPWPSQLLFSSDGKHLIGTTIPLTRWRVADWNLDPPARGVRNVHELRRSIAEHQGKKKYLDQPASGMVSVRLVESDRELLKTGTRTQPALSPDESLLLVTGREEKGDAFVKVWNMDRMEAIHTFMVGAVGHIIVTPDGRNVLTLAANEPIRVFDLVTQVLQSFRSIPIEP